MLVVNELNLPWSRAKEVKNLVVSSYLTCFYEHKHLHDGEVLVFGGDSVPVITTGIFYIH